MRVEHEGFVADVRLANNDELIGEVRDTRLPIEARGRTVDELRSDLAIKISAYRECCERRGVGPFDTPHGKSTLDLEAEMKASLGLELPQSTKQPPEWPHRHENFFDGKAWQMQESAESFRKLAFTRVPQDRRLPIDDVLDHLRSRTKSPRLLDVWTTGARARDLSWFVRFQLANAFMNVAQADPRKREIRRDFDFQFLEDAQALQSAATEFLSKYHDDSRLPTFACAKDNATADEQFRASRALKDI